MEPHPGAKVHSMASNGNTRNVPPTVQTEDFYKDDLPKDQKDTKENLDFAPYFRARYANRENIMDDKVKKELQRIDLVRGRVSGALGDPAAIEKLRKFREEWRDHARKESDKNLRNVPKKFKELKVQIEVRRAISEDASEGKKRLSKENIEPFKSKVLKEQHMKRTSNNLDKRLKYFQKRLKDLDRGPEYENALLKLVKKWPEGGKPPHDQYPQNLSQSQPDPYQYFDVRQITLKEVNPGGGDEKYFELEKDESGEPKGLKKYPIEEFLDSTGEKIFAENEPGTIRYFHLPANNMDWIERLMARYYGEAHDIDRNNSKLPTYRKKTPNVLRPEFWKGQQHGSTTSDPIHSRHMRSKLCVIPSDRGGPKSAKKFALFMPFLHWEMSMRKKRMAEIISKCVKEEDEKNWEIGGFERSRIQTHDLADVIKRTQQKRRVDLTFSSPKAPKKHSEKYTPWGKYMLQIAKVADILECERDERLIKEYIFKESPLHLRRTLDQSYYWKLENTTPRDQDQVVYRGTNDRFKHRQLVMVDQLWLWILDENTIITAFPRRWGINKPDFSGVHKTIRNRLADMQEGDIRSIYDLASIIIDQCSRIFFDRTKPIDERPEVLDIFANAIANASELSTNAFDGFYRHIENLKNRKFNRNTDREATANYFHINDEVLLLREALDISAELKMMQRVHDCQLQVAKEYKKALQDGGIRSVSKGSISSFSIQPTNPSDMNLFKEGNLEISTNTMKLLKKYKNVPQESIAKATDLLEELESRKSELEVLERGSKDVSDQLTHLLDLKQQQSSALEAKEALRQGQTIMIFTIVTIVFLPLGFMTSFFGMNNTYFMNHPMSLSLQFELIFPISLGVILFSLLWAFPELSLRIWQLPPARCIRKYFQRYVQKKKRDKYIRRVMQRSNSMDNISKMLKGKILLRPGEARQDEESGGLEGL